MSQNPHNRVQFRTHTADLEDLGRNQIVLGLHGSRGEKTPGAAPVLDRDSSETDLLPATTEPISDGSSTSLITQ